MNNEWMESIPRPVAWFVLDIICWEQSTKFPFKWFCRSIAQDITSANLHPTVTSFGKLKWQISDNLPSRKLTKFSETPRQWYILSLSDRPEAVTIQKNMPVFYLVRPKTGIILGIGSTSRTQRYIVTASLIGWAYTRNDPCNHRNTQI